MDNREELQERKPKTCANRTNNNFRCARDNNGTPRTPATDGSDCANCPNYVYSPSRDAEKAKVADSDAKKGSAIATTVLIVTAVLIAAGIFALTVLLRSCGA